MANLYIKMKTYFYVSIWGQMPSKMVTTTKKYYDKAILILLPKKS